MMNAGNQNDLTTMDLSILELMNKEGLSYIEAKDKLKKEAWDKELEKERERLRLDEIEDHLWMNGDYDFDPMNV